ncbi:MAG TPA: membrane protein insertion efficiency factor YidD [Thermodesulfobacteriota bacterium]|nr:membrane protein insertion efficiency factor YidD [Thermodesulfobacteriota bacterium]
MKLNPFVLLIDLSINTYRYFISPILPHSCRFYPSCSEYALQAFRKYGFLKGSWLALKRLTKCHPLSAGGYDPIS